MAKKTKAKKNTKARKAKVAEVVAGITAAPVTVVDEAGAQVALQDGKLLTTHEAAGLLQCNPSSIVKWINDGQLEGTFTPGGHRRVAVKTLRQFALNYRMALDPRLGAPTEEERGVAARFERPTHVAAA